jgi:LysR family hydrogen peroxide-inducible transcriptional activator
MTLTELRYLVMLCREHHFGRAAERCHVSQPSLSVAIRKLEDRLGVTLFERTSTGVRTTPMGERVCQQAEKVLIEAAKVEEIASSGKNPLVGPLRIGVIPTIAPYLLPKLIPQLARLAPDMPLHLQENFTHNLAVLLKNGEMDAAILSAPFGEAGIVTRAMYDEPFEVALPARHPLAAKQQICREEIDPAELLVLGQGNCFRDQVMFACPQFSTPGKIEEVVEATSLETLRHMTASGAGISVVPASACAVWPKDESLMCIRPFAPPSPSRRVVLAWRATFPRPAAMEALYQAICLSPPEGTTVVHPNGGMLFRNGKPGESALASE